MPPLTMCFAEPVVMAVRKTGPDCYHLAAGSLRTEHRKQTSVLAMKQLCAASDASLMTGLCHHGPSSVLLLCAGLFVLFVRSLCFALLMAAGNCRPSHSDSTTSLLPCLHDRCRPKRVLVGQTYLPETGLHARSYSGLQLPDPREPMDEKTN